MKFYKITFSSATQTIDGKDVTAELERAIKIYQGMLRQKGIKEEMSEEDKGMVKENILSASEGEKRILIQLLENAVNIEKKIEIFNEIADTIQQIKNSNGYIVFAETDLNRIKKSYEKVDKIPSAWLRYLGLFKQIQSPQDITEDYLKGK